MPWQLEPVKRLIDAFATLPGIGRRSAERLAYHILRLSEEEALALAAAIRHVKQSVRPCTVCGGLTEADPCAICADPARDRSAVCVVELPQDVLQIEKSGSWRGLYHVLMGHVAPLDGVEPEDLRLRELVARLKGGEIRELVVATNPNVEGDETALCIRQAIAQAGVQGVRITRPARGLPLGGEIEFLDGAVLGEALRDRREV
jgi:recombination protein RecR